MKITRVRTFPITLIVRPEFFIVSSAGAHPISRYLLIAIETDEGLTGWGEASVVPVWSGETQGGASALVEDYFAPMLAGRDPQEYEPILREMDTIIDNPFTKAAVEMALLDLVCKKEKRPVFELLGGLKNSLQIPIKFSIGLRTPGDTAKIALGKVKEGFSAIKIKVGPDPETDLRRVEAVREAVGPDIRLIVDVNGGWSVPQAIREIPRYEKFNLEYIEQPTPRWDIEGMAKVRAASKVPIMADESVFTIWQAEQVIAKRAADLISIYPGKNGGILKSQQICNLAEKAGIGCHLGSNLEWDIGSAAMCHLAAACANVQMARFPVDILGPLYYAIHPRVQPLQFNNGCVSVPTGAGLGIQMTVEEAEALTRCS
jgi:muconate cycloisomerase